MLRRVLPTLLFAGAAFGQVTFYKDVLPILQTHCQECHRPGEIGPMPLLTYEEARPWAKSIKENVLKGKMPPWPADSRFGKFSNDRSLTHEQIDTLAKWADGGAAQGKKAEAPPARTWTDGWNISKPDVVLGMPTAVDVPAKGTVEYQYIVVPSGFTEDKWVQAVEVRPSNRALVHHAVIYMREPGKDWLTNAKPGVPFVPVALNDQDRFRNTVGGNNELLTTYTPGMVPDMWGSGRAKKIKAGTDFIFQMHYTANGKAGSDQTRIGLVLAKEPPAERVLTTSALSNRFKIPAGDSNYSSQAEFTLRNGGTLLSLFPHMHLRGKGFQYEVVYPDGKTDTLLKLKSWDLNWQLSYHLEKPLELPPGAKIRATAWWDNSPNNPANPDPKVDVTWGEQSWEEMLVGFVDFAVPNKR
jgi:hypothetical protein